VNYSAEACGHCEGLELGGSSVEEGVGQPVRVPQVVMECMATIIGDHVGNPGFQDLGDFSQRIKILGPKNSHVFQCRIFMVESDFISFVKQMFQLDIETAHTVGLDSAVKRLAIRFQHQCSIFCATESPN
jgi:hypothetical protein